MPTSTTSPTKPHDALVHWVFSQPENARGELLHLLAALIDWGTLALCPGRFIDDDLAATASDLLFSVKLAGEPALLHFLFEHQSTIDRMMAFRDLCYEVRIWTWWRRDHPDDPSLPIIIPILLCHAPHPWPTPVRFEHLLNATPATLAAIGDLVPRFRLLVDDLTTEEDAALRARAMTTVARLTLWCLRHCRNKDEMLATLAAWSGPLRELGATPDGLCAFRLLLRYIFGVHRSKDEIVPQFQAILPEQQVNEMMTIADELREEGRLEGEIRGEIKGERTLLARVLTARFGSLPPAAAHRIEAATPRDLETWADRAATAPTLEAVLTPPNGSK